MSHREIPKAEMEEIGDAIEGRAYESWVRLSPLYPPRGVRKSDSGLATGDQSGASTAGDDSDSGNGDSGTGASADQGISEDDIDLDLVIQIGDLVHYDILSLYTMAGRQPHAHEERWQRVLEATPDQIKDQVTALKDALRIGYEFATEAPVFVAPVPTRSPLVLEVGVFAQGHVADPGAAHLLTCMTIAQSIDPNNKHFGYRDSESTIGEEIVKGLGIGRRIDDPSLRSVSLNQVIDAALKPRPIDSSPQPV
ncbi:MAG: hypothetical protein Q8Q49_01715 [bacterium]|nr:hypothetical protein [bacterium]